MIVQGSNNPITINFNAPVENFPVLLVTLWTDKPGYSQPYKMWKKTDMTVSKNTAICNISEAETKELPAGLVYVEAKGLDGDGNTVFWDACAVDVKQRRDSIISLSQIGG